MRRFLIATALITTFGAAGALAGPGHKGDVVVGLNSAGGLAVEVGGGPVALDPGADPFFGWFGEEPGFTNNKEDEPGEGFFALPLDAEIELLFVTIPAAFNVYDNDGAFTPILEGQAWRLSPNSPPFGVFDIHPYWHIDSSDPAFDPDQLATGWEVVMQVRDVNGAYAASESFSVTFVPEPASLALLALGALVAVRRR